MQTYRFRGIVTALSSITHNGGQVHGTEALLRREKFMQENYTPIEVPVLSGNGVRGKLRDCHGDVFRLGFGTCEQLFLTLRPLRPQDGRSAKTAPPV